LRDQARDIQQGALNSVGDWTQTQEERKRDQRDVSRDRVTDRADQIAGLELVQEYADVERGQRGRQRVDGVGNRQQGCVISRQGGAQVVDDVGRRREQRRVG